MKNLLWHPAIKTLNNSTPTISNASPTPSVSDTIVVLREELAAHFNGGSKRELARCFGISVRQAQRLFLAERSTGKGAIQ